MFYFGRKLALFSNQLDSAACPSQTGGLITPSAYKCCLFSAASVHAFHCMVTRLS